MKYYRAGVMVWRNCLTQLSWGGNYLKRPLSWSLMTLKLHQERGVMSEIPYMKVPEISAEERRESIVERLEREAPIFTDLNNRVERSAGLDASLNKAKEMSLKY